jgi:hypothetical protein
VAPHCSDLQEYAMPATTFDYRTALVLIDLPEQRTGT